MSTTSTTTTSSSTASTSSTMSTTSSTASTMSTTSTISTTSSTMSSTSTTTEPPRRFEGAYYYRFTQATANRLPDWTRSKQYRYSNTQQLLQPFGKESEELNSRMRRHLASLFLGTMDMDQMDMVYQISLPYSFQFEFDFTDPTNPRPKPPYTRGIIGTTEIVIESIEENNIESFWYDPLPTRITIGDDEVDLLPADVGLLATGDVLPATAIGAGIITATYTDPFIPGRLYVTIAGGDKFGHKDDLVEAPAYVELEGVTVKDTEETERVYFYYNASKITKKYWKEITKATVYNVLPTTATLTITSMAGTMQQIQDPAYVEYDTVGGRSSYWELDESNTAVMLQQILPVARVITGESRPGFQQDVHRTWILQDELGIELPWADIVDYALERFRPYTYVLMDTGILHIYNKWPEYPDVTSMRFLKERTDSCNTWIDVSYDEGILDDEIRLSASVIAPTKEVAFYSLQGSKPSHDNDWYYINTDDVWGGTEIDARVTLDPPTNNLPYIGYVVPLDEHGVHAFKLTTRYTDGTEDVDVVLIWSRYKLPLATFDLTAIDTDLIDPLAICFDYNQTLWLGGTFTGPDFLFKELDLHADLMLIDYDKKLIYLREEYEEVWVNDLTPPTPTGGAWIEIFTNAFWKDDVTYLGSHFTWTGTEWEQLSSPYTGQLVPVSPVGWHTGYRPEYMRISYTGPSTIRVRLKDEDGLSIVDELSYSSGDIMTLYWNTTDLAELEFQWEDTGLTITDTTIEFYQVDSVTGTTTTTTTTTTSTTSSSTASTASTASTVSTTSTTASTASTVSTTTTGLPWVEYIGSGPPSQTNSHWTGALDMAWTGTQWDNIGWPFISEVGTWASGFRPTYIRVTHTVTGNYNLKLYDSVGIIAQQNNYVSGTPVPITFAATDITGLYFENANADLLVSSIEFV